MKIVLFALITLTVGSLTAQPADTLEGRSFSVKQAQAFAVEHGYVARLKQLDVAKSKRQVKQYLGTGLPQVEAKGEFQNFINVPTQVLPDFLSPVIQQNLLHYGLIDESQVGSGSPMLVPAKFGTNYTLSGGISASQMIFNGSYFVGLQAARALVNLKKQAYEQTGLDVRVAVTKAYYQVLTARKTLSLLRENKTAIQKTYSDTKAMFKQGVVEEQDVDQVHLNLLNINSAINETENAAELARKSLNFQMGIPVDTHIVLSDSLEPAILAGTDSTLAQVAPDYEGNPTLKLAESSVVTSQLNLKNEKVQYLPKLNAFFSYQQQAQRDQFNFAESDMPWFPSTVWGVKLSIPLFSGFSRLNKVKGAAIEYHQSQVQLEQTRQQLSLAVSKARSTFEHALKNYRVEVQNLALAKKIQHNTQIKYENGVASSTEYNVAQTQYLQRQSSFVQAELQLLNAHIELEKALNKF